jgi:hypothetical protein
LTEEAAAGFIQRGTESVEKLSQITLAVAIPGFLAWHRGITSVRQVCLAKQPLTWG